MKKILLLALAFSCSHVHALETPAPGKYDRRVKSVNYNPDQVFKIIGHYGFSTHIQFADGENITNVALGDQAAWHVVPLNNHLFLKPKENQPETNMTVITTHRVYTFELNAHWSKSGAKPRPNDMFFQVKFEYPMEKKQADLERLKMAELEKRMEADSKPSAFNYNYWAQGDTSLQPLKAYDDGRFTYITFNKNTDMPAVYIENGDGSESLVNTHVEGNTIVVHKIANTLVLRNGKSVLGIFNKSFNVVGVDNTSKTTQKGVKRVLKGAN